MLTAPANIPAVCEQPTGIVAIIHDPLTANYFILKSIDVTNASVEMRILDLSPGAVKPVIERVSTRADQVALCIRLFNSHPHVIRILEGEVDLALVDRVEVCRRARNENRVEIQANLARVQREERALEPLGTRRIKDVIRKLAGVRLDQQGPVVRLHGRLLHEFRIILAAFHERIVETCRQAAAIRRGRVTIIQRSCNAGRGVIHPGNLLRELRHRVYATARQVVGQLREFGRILVNQRQARRTHVFRPMDYVRHDLARVKCRVVPLDIEQGRQIQGLIGYHRFSIKADPRVVGDERIQVSPAGCCRHHRGLRRDGCLCDDQVAGLAGIIGILELQESGDVATTFARLACRDQVGPFEATGQGSHHGHEDTRRLRVTRRIGRSDCKRVQAVFEQSRVPAPCVLIA